MLIGCLLHGYWNYWLFLDSNNQRINYTLFDDYSKIIWWLLDHYLTIICKAKNLPDFVRLCCLNIPVAKPARAEKVISDLLYSSLQGDPCELWCRRWQSYECKVANSQLRFLHLKLRNLSVSWVCVWLLWRRIGNLSSGNWFRARWFALPDRSRSFALQATAVGFTRVSPNSQHSIEEQQAKTNITDTCIVNESCGLIHLNEMVTVRRCVCIENQWENKTVQ